MAESFEVGNAVTPDMCTDMSMSTIVPEEVRMKFFHYLSKVKRPEITAITHQPRDLIKVT